MTYINCSNLWVHDMNIDNKIIDYLPVHDAVCSTGGLTVAFGCVT